MRIVKMLSILFAKLRSGCGHLFSTRGSGSYGALIASGKAARRVPNLPYDHRLFLILAVSILFSCGTVTRPDPAPAYSDGGYRSVEMSLCGKYFFGVGGCHYPSGAAASDHLGVQGYNEGEVTVFSELCHVDWKSRYRLNEFVQVSLSDLLDVSTLTRAQSCTLRVVVSPDPIKGSEEKVYPRVGEIYIEVRSQGTLGLDLPQSSQVRASNQPDVAGFQLPTPVPGEYLLSRCLLGDVHGTFSAPVVVFDVLDRVTSCKYQYFIRTSDGKKYSQVYLRNVYKADTILIARPTVTRSPDRICISADPVVTTFLSIDNEWTNKTELCATGKGPFKIRVWTTKRNYFEVVK